MKELHYIALSLTKQIGFRRYKKLKEVLKDVENIFNMSGQEVSKLLGFKKDVLGDMTEYLREAEKVYKKLKELGIEIITVEDERYPEEFKRCDDGPIVVYWLGNLEVLYKEKIGVVGTRRISPDGFKVAKEFGRFLGKNAFTVVSGFAKGIDITVQDTCIENGGYTVSVLPCGLDYVYPKEHKEYLKKFLKSGRGLFISEYPPGTKPTKEFFPIRNRLIASLSKILIVLEAPKDSGALITARMALRYGIPVFTTPGHILDPKYTGNNLLLKEGAKPILSPKDIYEYFQQDYTIFKEVEETKADISLSPEEQEIFSAISIEGSWIEELAEKLKKPTSYIQMKLLELELKGVIYQSLEGKFFKSTYNF